MRPFKFFFALSLGVIFFFFVARFVILALVLAAVFSGVFFLIRRARYYFSGLGWNQYHPRYHYDHYSHPQRLLNEHRPDDVPFYDFDREEASISEWQVIKIQ
jgi:hypothetical protein